jgi:hypothetical protein
MLENLTIKQELLARVMSDISERCYCAGWMQNLEYVLWDITIKGERQYGLDMVTQRDIDIMKLLSKETNSWIIFEDKIGETAIAISDWERKFDQDTQSNHDLLNY